MSRRATWLRLSGVVVITGTVTLAAACSDQDTVDTVPPPWPTRTVVPDGPDGPVGVPDSTADTSTTPTTTAKTISTPKSTTSTSAPTP